DAAAYVDKLLKNVSFITYTKLMVNEDKIDTFSPDYIVLDEFHRCGAPEWGNSVYKLINTYPEAKLLGLSATNIRYLDNRRDMAQELFGSCVASQMSLGEAIAKKILPAPEYVISMYSYKEELKRLSDRVKAERDRGIRKHNEKLIEELRRALENAEGLNHVFSKHMKSKSGRYLVFCANKEHMEEMLAHVSEWFDLVDKEPHVYAVYYDNPQTSKEFAAFKADKSSHLKLLFCIDMLNEGIHVEDIDGVILLRPTVSPILYLQQIGRGLSAGSRESDTPVIFDIVNNFDSLYSIDALQEEMDTAISLMPCTKGENKGKYCDSFTIFDELRDCRKIFKELSSNLSASWSIYYLACKKYYEKHNDLCVPSSYVTDEGLKLGSWLKTQRRVYAGKVCGRLTDEQIAKLEKVGMIWDDAQTQNFTKGCEALELYRREYGNADVPARYISDDGFPLGKWVGNIRTAYKNKKLKPEKIDSLNKLEMIWDVREYRWNLNYEAAREYFAIHGDLQVPHSYMTKTGLCLGRWLSNQIKTYNGIKTGSTPLSKDQIDKLESIGIVWKNKYDYGWDKKYEIAKAYFEEHGNLDISSNYTMDGMDIGKWINMVRLKMANPDSSNLVLSTERMRQLDVIGVSR
ncbi:MAG: Helicase associated domain protein, partial [Ruminococcus flavefaciens]|nr:Helicase associated domain protein [Ruminococcus flavefaciens]